MNDHPRWLVHGHQRVVFVKNVEWHRLRGGAFAHARPDWQFHFDVGSFMDVHRCPVCRRPIDRYQTFGDPPLRASPRHAGNLRDSPDQHLIQSQARIATVCREMDNQELLLVYLCWKPTITIGRSSGEDRLYEKGTGAI